jgi:hypothetical protein
MIRCNRHITATVVAVGLAATGILSAPASAAEVDAAPTKVLLGSDAFPLYIPVDVIVSPSGEVHVADAGPDAINTYAKGASGKKSPVRRIDGPNDSSDNTGLTAAHGIALGSDGKLFVANTGEDEIVVFASKATGNVAPIRKIAGFETGLDHPEDLAIDSAGRIFVSNSWTDEILVFAPGAAGNVAPIRTIGGPTTTLDNPAGLLLDGSGSVYVANHDTSTVTAFPVASNGNVAPSRTLGGPATGIDGPWGLAMDSDRNLYVANQTADSVTVFAKTVQGNSAPTATLSGAATTLDEPTGVFVRPDRAVVVTQRWTATHSASIMTFAPLVALPPPLLRPGKVRSLEVTGAAKAKKRTVKWKVPSFDGGPRDYNGERITKYKIVVKKGSDKLLSTTVKAPDTKLKLKKKKLRKGKLTVYVAAKNEVGYGNYAKATFKVK